jgi:hypothetical protein
VTHSILLVGNSHVHAVRRAAKESDTAQFHAYDLDREKRVGGTRDPVFVLGRHLANGKYGQVGLLAMAIRGNFHGQIGLFNHPSPYFIAGLPPKGQSIPVDMLQKFFEGHLQRNLDIAQDITKTIIAERRVLLAAPPPIVDDEHLTRTIGGLAEKLPLGFASPELRLKLYDLQCAIQREHANALNATFLPAPPDASDSNGFMRPDYFGTDSAHGNVAYGQLVLDQLTALHDRGL